MNLRRPLNTKELAETFAEMIFEDDSPKELDKKASKIFNAEISLQQLEAHPTSTHSDYRCRKYRKEHDRQLLRKEVLSDLTKMERLPNDDDISLGNGGAKPNVPLAKRRAYIVSGAPASGKSGIATKLADETGSYILDSDYAKRKLPEYTETVDGASLVHDEADRIIFAPQKSLFEFCVYSGYNMVIPLVGKTYMSMESIFNRLHSCGYSVHLINVALDRKKCVHRAYERYLFTSRYVPLSYIFDEVGNEPERIYFLMKRTHLNNGDLASFAQLSTDVERDAKPIILETSPDSPVSSWRV